MSDRIHFCISSSIVCVLIGLVSWSQFPSTSQLVTAQDTLDLANAETTIHSFLDSEEGLSATMVPPSFSVESENEKRKKYIPLNVVPAQNKKRSQSQKSHSEKTGLSTSKQTVVSKSLKRHLQLTEYNANELIGQSSDSFARGLMSLVDYNLALNIAFDSKIETAEIRQTKQAKLNLLNEKQKLIQQAVEQLQAFNQPASQGWYGDLVHAKLLLAQNQYEIASVTKDRDHEQIALEQISKNSDDYFAIRKAELQVGEADLSEFRRATGSIYIASQERYLFFGGDGNDSKGLIEYADGLNEIKLEVEWMASRGAGLGRADLVDLSKAHLAYIQGKYYQENNQPIESRNLFTESMNHAKAAWDTRINTYYPVGTASLHDITTAWIMWKESETKYAKVAPTNSTTFDREIKAGLDRMVNTTESIRDRRGRIASDISLVRCLKNSELLTDLKAQQSK